MEAVSSMRTTTSTLGSVFQEGNIHHPLWWFWVAFAGGEYNMFWSAGLDASFGNQRPLILVWVLRLCNTYSIHCNVKYPSHISSRIRIRSFSLGVGGGRWSRQSFQGWATNHFQQKVLSKFVLFPRGFWSSHLIQSFVVASDLSKPIIYHLS